MKLSPDNLPNDVDLLKQLLLETLAAKDNVIVLKDAEIAALKHSVQRLLEQFRLAQ
jgi:transposase